jgi:acetyl-CoA carboxylase biotin carboxyl carrier protein
MKLEEIQDLIKFVAKSGVNEVEIEQDNFKIVIKTDSDRKRRMEMQQPMQYVQMPQQPMQMAQQAPAPAAAPAAAAPAEPAKPASDDSKYITIKSPMIGTFYRSPSPDKPPFVNVGDEIKPGKVICIIEAMKLFNEIESEVSGRIVKVLTDDTSPAEYDQPLFLVDPS